ncbi:hypothetical protein TNIN_249271 [Trichonephila inaurata madagascariensis]|uniref:Uncharacterized protein n=1 Tax=Trichonephila inaurata madagascariensis TaxID=2747483 RepID=A0A8X6YR38_9ARAC|nr:hypothetical protein TNIN_249271 [Trichonephila inaurata madagascariensis]
MVTFYCKQNKLATSIIHVFPDHRTRFVSEAAAFLVVKVYQQRNPKRSNESTSNPSPCAITYSCRLCNRLQRIR